MTRRHGNAAVARTDVAPTPRRHVTASLCAGLLAAMALLGACTGGGGGGDSRDPLEWGRFRHDNSNLGLGGGIVGNNRGAVTALLQIDAAGFGLTSSTPIIGLDDTIYLGTASGLLALNKAGEVQWLFDRCELPAGSVTVGAISGSPAVTVEKDLVVGTDDGHIFALRDMGETFTCNWVRPAAPPLPIRASPALLTYPLDQSLITAYVPSSSGHLLALNGDGSERWRFPQGNDAFDPLTASPAVTVDGFVFLATPDGVLHAIDPAGKLRWQVQVDVSEQEADRLPSPATGTSIYSTGAVLRCEQSDAACTSDVDCEQGRCLATGQVTAINADGTLKWRYRGETAEARPKPILGSPAATLQTVVEDRLTEEGTINVIDTIVYVVDDEGTVHGIRDATGELFVFRDPDDDSLRKPALVRLMTSRVSTSPALSSDVFVVFATDDGYIYATRVDTDFDETWPCSDCSDGRWEALQPQGGGRVKVSSETIRSSPIIDFDGTIYVTADDGILYAIGSP